MAQRQEFEVAATSVAQWLDGLEQVRRDPTRREDAGRAWLIDLQGGYSPVLWVRLVLPAGFPLEPCRFEVDPQLELKLPHVERGGKLCLGIDPYPSDLVAPVPAVVRGIEQLQKQFLDRLHESGWTEAEFHKERLTYWALHCTDTRRHTRVDGRLGQVYFDMAGLQTWSFGTVAGYLLPATKPSKFYRQLVTCGETDADAIARRHGWAQGTYVKGRAVIARLPENQRWTPTTWPTNARELEAVLAAATDGEASLGKLLENALEDFKSYRARHKFKTTFVGRQIPKPHAAPQLFVLLVQSSAVYGYQVLPAFGPTLRGVTIQPFEVQRMDADWSMARDHALPQLHGRRSKRVLLLGTGSLGSVVALLLARAGVGTMVMLDNQCMAAENTSRHVLGLQHAGRAKVTELADEIKRAVPGIEVKGIHADAVSWLAKSTAVEPFDLVVECSAERSVRQALALHRTARFGLAPVVHTWLEPMCSAAHVVLSQPEVPWPLEDPTNDHVNASDLSADETRVTNPACSAGFHPYGAADVTQVAAFAAERILTVLDEPSAPSTVWSWVRSKAFFDRLGLPVKTRAIVPEHGGPLDAATVTRSLSSVLAAPAP